MFINGVPLYENFDALKKVIGYVPQSDIVYDNLTLHDMLMYTAKLRLPADTGREDREAAIGRALDMVELRKSQKSDPEFKRRTEKAGQYCGRAFVRPESFVLRRAGFRPRSGDREEPDGFPSENGRFGKNYYPCNPQYITA